MSYNQRKLYTNNQKMMDCEWPLGMIHFSLILRHNMDMKYAEEPFNMGVFLPKVSFRMGIFSDPQHTHLGICILESPPPPPHKAPPVLCYSWADTSNPLKVFGQGGGQRGAEGGRGGEEGGGEVFGSFISQCLIRLSPVGCMIQAISIIYYYTEQHEVLQFGSI